MLSQILNNKVICLKNKKALKSILMRRFFEHFLAFLINAYKSVFPLKFIYFYIIILVF